MANATDRLNQLQQYMDYYKQHGLGATGGDSQYDRSTGQASMSPAYNPSQMSSWAQSEQAQQDAIQQQEDQNAMFKSMYAGNGQSQFGAPPAYVQPQNQQQQPNPYSARAMQLNGGGQNGGQNGGNTLADMFRNYNKGG